jgi:hypothetical protein
MLGVPDPIHTIMAHSIITAATGSTQAVAITMRAVGSMQAVAITTEFSKA